MSELHGRGQPDRTGSSVARGNRGPKTSCSSRAFALAFGAAILIATPAQAQDAAPAQSTPEVFVNTQLLERLAKEAPTPKDRAEPEQRLETPPDWQLKSRLLVVPESAGQPAEPSFAPPAPSLLATELQALEAQAAPKTQRQAAEPRFETPPQPPLRPDEAIAAKAAAALAAAQKAAAEPDTAEPDTAVSEADVGPPPAPSDLVPEGASPGSAPVAAASGATPEAAPSELVDIPDTGSAGDSPDPSDAGGEATPDEGPAPKPSDLLSELAEAPAEQGQAGTPVAAPSVPEPPAPRDSDREAEAPAPPPSSALPDDVAGLPPQTSAESEAELESATTPVSDSARATPSESQEAQEAKLPPAPIEPYNNQIFFESGSTELLPEARTLLQQVARQLAENEDDVVELRAYASGRDARRVSLNRAIVARAYLSELGVSSKRIVLRPLGNNGKLDRGERIDILRRAR